MQITPGNLAFFFTGLQNRFWQAWGVTQMFYPKICSEVPSSTEQELYGWIGMVEKGRRWDGARVVHTAGPQTYTLVNEPHEDTYSIDKFKLLDDSYGIYFPQVQFLGEQAAKYWDYQLRDLLQNIGTQTGTRQNGLDTLTHWNTAHPVDFYDAAKGTYSNDFTGGGMAVGGITVGGAISPNAYATLRQEMLARKSENGEALGVVPNLMMGPSQIDIVARVILQASFFSPASLGGLPSGGLTGQVGNHENMLKGTADWLMVPELGTTSATNANQIWYLMDTTRPIKPFIHQNRQGVNWVQRIREDDPAVFDLHRYLYGWDLRGAVGWGPAWLSSRSGP